VGTPEGSLDDNELQQGEGEGDLADDAGVDGDAGFEDAAEFEDTDFGFDGNEAFSREGGGLDLKNFFDCKCVGIL